MEQEARLMEEALRLEIPIMGHCLGSQLLARALGAEVSANRPVSFELGWYPVEVVQTDLSDWTEGFQGDEVFHWHNENFALPAGAVRLLSNQHCTNQAFLHGIHLGMQFHIEITAAQVKDWTQSSDDPQNWAHLESVQSQEEMYRMLEERVSRSNRMADQIYHRWSLGLIKD
jgi:GMP synthase-like glutamine amidotransferase